MTNQHPKQPKPISVSGVQATYLRNRIQKALVEHKRKVQAHFEQIEKREPPQVARARKLVAEFEKHRNKSWRRVCAESSPFERIAEDDALHTEGLALFAQPPEAALGFIAAFELRLSSALMKLQKSSKK